MPSRASVRALVFFMPRMAFDPAPFNIVAHYGHQVPSTILHF